MKKFLAGAVLYLASTLSSYAGVACSLPFTLTNGTVADASQVMANYNALVNCLTQAAQAGANTDITSLLGLTTPITPAGGGSNVFLGVTGTGSGNAQTVSSTTPTLLSLQTGYTVIYVAGATNTGATTLAVGTTPAKSVVRSDPGGTTALIGSEILLGQLTIATYDGTNWVLLNNHQVSGGFGTPTALSVGGTTDLGSIPSHNVVLTGGGAISSFGATADFNFPYYHLTFNAPTTLVYNAVSMKLPGLANIVALSGDTATVMNAGGANWQVVSFTQANIPSVRVPPLCGAIGLFLRNSAGPSPTQIDYSASSVELVNAGGTASVYANNVSGTINLTVGNVTPTADGMDGETRPVSAWLNIFLIGNGSTVNGLATRVGSLNLPTGYTFFCRLGAMPTDAATNLFVTTQFGDRAQYIVTTGSANTATLPVMASGMAGTYSSTVPGFVSVPAAGNGRCGPPSAVQIFGIVTPNFKAAGISSVVVASNLAYSGAQSAAGNVPIVDINQAETKNVTVPFSAIPEGSAIAWASSQPGGAIICQGWIDQVNAH